MYENIKYEDILQRMLNRVPRDLDKREGSVIYTALAPAAAEMQLMYIEFDTILRETFADTASRDYLIRRGAERGIHPKPATNAILMAISEPDTLEIEIGERFRLGVMNYVVIEKMFKGRYKMQCETEGAAGNSQLGYLIPVGTVNGLEAMTLTEVLVPGEDGESTEDFRKRYFASFDQQNFSGNKKDYQDKTNAIDGVGATKVTRAYKGPGTVRLTILDSDFNQASNTLLKTVQEYIDPKEDGSGDGLAPIDHIVTVTTPDTVEIHIETNILYHNGYTYLALQEQIMDEIKAYLLELRRNWEEQSCVIRISQIEARLITIQGIMDISSTKINGMPENLELTEYEIPVFGGVAVG